MPKKLLRAFTKLKAPAPSFQTETGHTKQLEGKYDDPTLRNYQQLLTAIDS